MVGTVFFRASDKSAIGKKRKRIAFPSLFALPLSLRRARRILSLPFLIESHPSTPRACAESTWRTDRPRLETLHYRRERGGRETKLRGQIPLRFAKGESVSTSPPGSLALLSRLFFIAVEDRRGGSFVQCPWVGRRGTAGRERGTRERESVSKAGGEGKKLKLLDA